MRAEEGQQKRARSIDSNSLIVPPGAHSLPCHHQGVYYHCCWTISYPILSYPMELALVLTIAESDVSPPNFHPLLLLFSLFFSFSHHLLCLKNIQPFFSFELYLKPVPIFYAFNYSSIQSTDNQGLLPVSSILYSNLFPAVLQLD